MDASFNRLGFRRDLLEDSLVNESRTSYQDQVEEEEARGLHSMSTSTTAGCPGKVTAAVRSWLLKEVLLLNECD